MKVHLQCVTFHLIVPDVYVPWPGPGNTDSQSRRRQGMMEAAHQVPDYMFYNYSPICSSLGNY